MLHYLLGVRAWVGEQNSDDPLLPVNYLNIKQRETSPCA